MRAWAASGRGSRSAPRSCSSRHSSSRVRSEPPPVGVLRRGAVTPSRKAKGPYVTIVKCVSSRNPGGRAPQNPNLMTVWPIKAARGGMAMSISRRDLLFASGMSLLTSLRHLRRSAAPPPQQPQTPTTPQARLLAALQGNRLPLTMTDGPAGPGWDWLVQQTPDARLTPIGEEHGVAQTAQIAGALFHTLRGSGYSRLAIEPSPILAQGIEAAGRR